MLAGCLIALAGCEPIAQEGGNTREIHKEGFQDGIAPMKALDEALQTEGQQAERAIFGQLQALLIKSYNGDANKLAADMSGALNDTKLKKLGMEASQLQGRYYKATDYVLKFSGKDVTITASYPGTRGYASNPFTLR